MPGQTLSRQRITLPPRGTLPIARSRYMPTAFIAAFFVICIALPGAAVRAETIRIIAFGTSNTVGKAIPRTDAYPAQLEAALIALDYDVTVENAGVNGDTTGGMLARIDTAVPEGVHIVLVEPGYNDARRGISQDAVRANLDTILERLRARGIEVLLFGVPKMQLSDLAREHVALYTAPIRSGFTRGTGKTRAEFAAPDGFHLNASAYELVVERIMPHVETLIGRVAANR